MTTSVAFGESDWPLSIKARNSADGVTLLVQTDDWREGITIRNDRAAVLAVLREAIATVEALGCEYGWGCTDTTCTEHGEALSRRWEVGDRFVITAQFVIDGSWSLSHGQVYEVSSVRGNRLGFTDDDGDDIGIGFQFVERVCSQQRMRPQGRPNQGESNDRPREDADQGAGVEPGADVPAAAGRSDDRRRGGVDGQEVQHLHRRGLTSLEPAPIETGAGSGGRAPVPGDTQPQQDAP